MPSFVRGVTSTLRDESMARGMLDRHRPPPTLSQTNRKHASARKESR